MRPFQIALLAIFGLLAIIALVVLSMYQSNKSQEEQAYGSQVIIWGSLSQDAFRTVMQEIGKVDKPFNVVTYREISEESFDSELVNAIAEGRGPDLIVLQSDALVQHRAKLLPVPYTSITERDFKDTYVDGAEIFARVDGVYGVPFAIDPMVVYWNRDMFSSNGIAQAPASWESVVADVVPRLTVRDSSRNVQKSAVAFGEYQNIAHAKNLLMLLSLQSGSKMITEKDGQYKVNLDEALIEGGRSPLQSAVEFYTDFSNVNSPLYSWNRAKPMDKESFIAGDLGLYFGMGSEYGELADKNPNLNFDIAPVPQGMQATALRTSGDFYAFAIPRASKNVQGAYAAATVLTSAQNADLLVQNLRMAPSRRDLVAQGDENRFRAVILQSALIARGWLDPNRNASDAIFTEMIEDVSSNRARVGEAVGDAIDRLILAF
jgi:ABC-type glycerol-3-phosphate transport system substrate-binding protein